MSPPGKYRWLTVVPPDDQDGAELVQQPNGNPAAEQYPKAIFERGIPAAMVGVDDLQAECERLEDPDVQVKVEPTDYGRVSLASFADTSGNLVQIQQRLRRLADRPGSIGCLAPYSQAVEGDNDGEDLAVEPLPPVSKYSGGSSRRNWTSLVSLRRESISIVCDEVSGNLQIVRRHRMGESNQNGCTDAERRGSQVRQGWRGRRAA